MPALLEDQFINVLHQRDSLEGKISICFQKTSAWISKEHALSEYCKYLYLHCSHWEISLTIFSKMDKKWKKKMSWRISMPSVLARESWKSTNTFLSSKSPYIMPKMKYFIFKITPQTAGHRAVFASWERSCKRYHITLPGWLPTRHL